MIFGSSLKQLFNDLSISEQSVKTSYGKQAELDLFIKESDNLRAKKYPLIWWVTNPVEDQGNFLRCASKLVLMVNTDVSWLSERRKINSFDTYISPLYEKVIDKLEKSAFKIHGDRRTRIKYEDIANYGVGSSKLGSKKSDKSIVTDYIDARVIDITLDYYK